MHTIVGEAYGCVFQVTFPEFMRELLVPRLPHGWTPSSSQAGSHWTVEPIDGHVYRILQDGEVVLAESRWGAVLGDLGNVVELWMAENLPGLIALHAGSIAWEGRVIALPGHTLTGKSTLVRAFLERGATYLSDEYVLLRPDGLVAPYPRALSLRPSGVGLSHPFPVENLGCPVASEPLPLGIVAQLRYEAEAGWTVRHASRAEGALACLSHCVPAQTRPIEALDHIATALATAQCLVGTRGEAEEAVDHLIDLLSDL